MAVKQTSDDLPWQLGTTSPQESASEEFLKTAASSTFPFLHVKITEDETIDDVTVDIKVNKKIYKFLKFGRSNDMLFYLESNGGLVQWEADMIVAMKILSKLEIFPTVEEWTIASRKSLVKVIDGEKIEPIFESESTLANSRDILSSLEILDQIDQTKMLFSTASEMLRDKIMDSGTLIYRLAMAIYHNRGVFTPTLTAIEDPGSTYLKLLRSSSYKKWKSEFSDIMKLSLRERIQTTKVLVAFVIASYVYYKTVKGDIDE